MKPLSLSVEHCEQVFCSSFVRSPEQMSRRNFSNFNKNRSKVFFSISWSLLRISFFRVNLLVLRDKKKKLVRTQALTFFFFSFVPSLLFHYFISFFFLFVHKEAIKTTQRRRWKQINCLKSSQTATGVDKPQPFSN